MNDGLNIFEKLDFTDIDLTAPDIVIKNLLDQLPAETNDLICGKIEPYDGAVMSYTKSGLSSLTSALGTLDKEVDIQDSLGEIGTETHKFECYVYTPEYEQFRYRVFFLKYNVSNYPATIVLEESVARSVIGNNRKYIFTCDTRDELEELIVNVLTSKRMISVMQELIRVNQAKKSSA